MKKLMAIGAIAFVVILMASMSAFGQAPETKTPPKKKPAGSAKYPPSTGQTSKAATAEDKVAINPQPLPPKTATGSTSAASKVSLNPQPLPPKQGTAASTSAGSKVSLNPQPLPPRQGASGANSAGNKVSLNPQPLPPKQGTTSVSAAKNTTATKAPTKVDSKTGAAGKTAQQ